MGEVLVARDSQLGRDVAIKRALDVAGAQALLAEAAMAALLEHPAIVPIYDVGQLPDGTGFYVMRLVRGNTLAHSLRDTRGQPAKRLALVGHVLDCCRAVAFAHRLGIVHRDLKPDNVLVGPLGETQVADWGLAATLADAALRTTVAGCPAYMAPEIARGSGHSEQADVFALGAILFELLTGQPPFAAATPAEQLSRAQSAVVSAPHDLAPHMPADLCAIAAQATAADPQLRYPTAQALAEDIGRFTIGQRVDAHAYSPLELGRRFMATFRLPLAVAALALVVTAAVVAVAWQRTAAERDRADIALQREAIALRRAELQLANTFAEQAQIAAANGLRMQAELLAARALQLRDLPLARGVLAAFGVQPRPALILDSQPDVEQPAALRAVRRHSQLDLIQSATGTPVATLNCPEQRQVLAFALAADGSTAVAACEGDSLTVWRSTSGHSSIPAAITAMRGVAALQLRDEKSAVAAGIDGALVQWDLSSAASRTVAQLAVSEIAGLALDWRRDRAVVLGQVGGTQVVRLADGAELARLPTLGRASLQVDAVSGAVAVHGVATQHWQLSPQDRPLVLGHGAGIATVAYSADGLYCAAGRGTGEIDLWHLPAALPAQHIQACPATVMQLVFAPTGHDLWAACAEPRGLRHWLAAPGPDGQVHWQQAETAMAMAARRLGVLRSGAVWLTDMTHKLRLFSPAGAALVEQAGGFGDGATASDGSSAMLVAAAGLVYRVTDGAQPTVRLWLADADARVVATDGSGQRVAYATGEAVVVRPADATAPVLCTLASTNSAVEELALSTDGTWLAAAHVDGTVAMARVGDTRWRASLRIHRQRAVAVAFHPFAPQLASGSWDGTVRLWSLLPVGAQAGPLAAEVLRGWPAELVAMP